MYCALQAAADYQLTSQQRVVVILPDSVRNYMYELLICFKLTGVFSRPMVIRGLYRYKLEETILRLLWVVMEGFLWSPILYFAAVVTFFFLLLLYDHLRSRCSHYIFILRFLHISSFFSPRLISAIAVWMSTILPHMMWP